MTAQTQTMTMTTTTTIQSLNGKKFDVCLMNPPYGENSGDTTLDMQFVKKCTEFSKIVIPIVPFKFSSNQKIYTSFYDEKHIDNIELIAAQELFGISPYGWNYACIYTVDDKIHNNINITLNEKTSIIENTKENRESFAKSLQYDKKLIDIINKYKTLYNTLLIKNNTMCHNQFSYIYEENKSVLKKSPQKKLERVKQYLKNGDYKYCLYKGSGNHKYDKVNEWNGEDPDKLFNGQICWLTNKLNVKNNIRYWLECPLCDLWRYYYFNKSKYAACGAYKAIPALDFEMSESDFKKYVDSLNDFTDDEIKILKENNIHNADKL